MRMIVNYYDPENGDELEKIELNLDNAKFDPEVANKFIADFDRCEHGRHESDACIYCSDAYGSLLSRGNPGHHEEVWNDNQGNRIYAFSIGGTAGWVVVDGQLGLSSDL